ncbi:GNAT family N-acetyltransferase [Tundrisphaera sp. TA3]|uniref:GNAT family N-acetyltransferase n=1 Tax=Tundrisphaera sp. TA3 TaxID=3435775 RepID=UPI003EB883F8
MNRFRTFRNGDPPALAELWNRSLPGRGVVRPLTPHEFDTLIIGRLDFRREGLIVAEGQGGRIVGFVHAGFGPISPEGPGHGLDFQLGTIAMLVVDAGQGGELASALFRAGEDYLRNAGAQVFYAGAQHPLDPFYRGVYGGSEFSGILDVDAAFRGAAAAAGYEAVATTARFEADLAGAEVRDPKAVLFRRQARVDVEEEAMPSGWWEALGIGPVEITRFRLLSRLDNREMARASTWDMAAFGRPDGRSRVGLFGVEVPADLRRKGYGRHLVAEILRHHRGRWGEIVAVQTDATNLPALGLYQGLGFVPTGTSTLFRRPGGPPA